MVLSFRPNSKIAKVTDALAKGETLTAGQAKSRFGVANFTATISDIMEKIEAEGAKHELWYEKTSTGKTAYGMTVR